MSIANTMSTIKTLSYTKKKKKKKEKEKTNKEMRPKYSVRNNQSEADERLTNGLS